MQLLRQFCVFTALLLSVPGEVFMWDLTIGLVKEGEKMLFTKWMP